MPQQLFAESEQGNIGRQDTALPAGTASVAPGGYGELVGLVKFPGRNKSERQENDPAVITASIFAQLKNTINAGPLTGIIVWASGNGAANTAEFDIPVETQTGPPVTPPLVPAQGGVQLSVVATSVEIRARNDANLIPSNQGLGVQLPLGGGPPGTTEPITVSASLGRGTHVSSGRVVKTVWAINNPANPLTAANFVEVFVPPFASSFRVMRKSLVGTQAGSIQISIGDNNVNVFDGGYDVAAGAIAPDIVLSGQAARIRIANTSAGSMDKVAVVFTLSL